MRRPALSLLFVPLFLGSLIFIPNVGAQNPPPAASAGADVRTKSNLAFEQGVKTFQAGRISEALSYFRESYNLLPRAAPLYNIAQCELGLDHPIEALDALRMYAASGGTSPVNEFFREAEQKIAKLRLKIEPPDALVRIDGKEAEKGASEWRLNPGVHTLEIQAPGYTPLSKRLDLERGSSQELSLALEPIVTPAASSSAEPVSSAPAAPIAPAKRQRSGAFWGATTVSAALLLTGTVTGVIALRNASIYNSQAPGHKDASLRSSGETLRVVADVSFGLAILSGVGAYLLSSPTTPTTSRGAWPSVAAGPAGGWLGVSGRYLCTDVTGRHELPIRAKITVKDRGLWRNHFSRERIGGVAWENRTGAIHRILHLYN